MMLNDRIIAFSRLGDYLRKETDNIKEGEKDSDLNTVLLQVQKLNPWFDRRNLLFTLERIAEMLDKPLLTEWLSTYSINTAPPKKRIALIMAGNIPLVGFHDFLCVLVSGHIAHLKMSSQDNVLLPFLSNKLIDIAPDFAPYFVFEEHLLTGFDAVIATGSNNSARYFDYYFGKYPHIIRKNRSSLAILTGDETRNELELLADDMCLYYGRGCRSVSSLFVPRNYDFSLLFEVLSNHAYMIENTKYFNNYEYNKAVFLINKLPFCDTGILLFQKKQALSAPISVVNYSEYDKIETVTSFVESHRNMLQCVVSAETIKNAVPFGKAQHPALNDYADNIDTLNFLTTCV